MLTKEEIANFAQEWFGCDKKQAKEFAKDLYKHQTTKVLLVDWLPSIMLVVVLTLYLIFHR